MRKMQRMTGICRESPMILLGSGTKVKSNHARAKGLFWIAGRHGQVAVKWTPKFGLEKMGQKN